MFIEKATEYMQKGPEYEFFLSMWKKIEKHPANGWALYRFCCDIWKQRKIRERRERYHSKPLDAKFARPDQVPLERQKKIEQQMSGVKPTLTVLGISEADAVASENKKMSTVPATSSKKKKANGATKKAGKRSRLTQSAAARFIDSAAMDDDENGSGEEDQDGGGGGGGDDADGFIVADDDAASPSTFSHAAVHNVMQLIDSGDTDSDDADFDDTGKPAKPKVLMSPVADERAAEAARIAKKKRKSSTITASADDDDVVVVVPPPPPPPAQVVSLLTPPVSQASAETKAPAASRAKKAAAAAAAAAAPTAAIEPLRIHGENARGTPLVYEHVFGTAFLKQKYLHTLEQLVAHAGFTLAAAIARVNEMFSADATMMLPLVELAHMVIVLCRGHLVDQALGLAPNTPSIADRETAREIGALAKQRDKLRVETMAVHNSVLFKQLDAADDDRYRRLLAFELLMTGHCVLALNFSERIVKMFSDSAAASNKSIPPPAEKTTAAIETVACCLLSPTARSTTNYEFACLTLASYLPASAKFPRRVVDPQLREPWRLVAPRYAILFDSIARRNQFLPTPFNSNTVARVVDTGYAASAPATAAAATTNKVPDSTAKNHAVFKGDDDFDDGAAAAAVAAVAETNPISALSKSLAALGCGPNRVPMRRLTLGLPLLVADRGVVVHDVSRLVSLYQGGAALVPNMALVRLFEMLRHAHNTPRDREDFLVPLSVGATRSKDIYKTGQLPDYEKKSNYVAMTLSNLVETHTHVDATDKTALVSLFDSNVTTARMIARDYGDEFVHPGTTNFKEYALVVMHVLVQFLRLHPTLNSVRIGAPAVLRDVALSTSVQDVRGAPIVLGKNELPATFHFCMPPDMRDLLVLMSTRYYQHIGLTINAHSTELIPDAAKHFERLHAAAKFPDSQRWIADYLSPTSTAVHTTAQMREFRMIFMPIMAALFPVENNHITLNGE